MNTENPGSGSVMNHLQGMEELISTWDQPSGSWIIVSRAQPGPSGEINLSGTATCRYAPIVPRSHPQFEELIEPGVRALVLCLTDSCHVVTYSSCQGHPPLADGRSPLRQVGILSRDDREFLRILTAVAVSANAVNRQTADSAVRVAVALRNLTSESGDRQSLELVFVPRAGREDQYYAAIEPVYDQLVQMLPSSFGPSTDGLPANIRDNP